MLSIPDDYHILLLQGGSSLQFSMIPMNFLRDSNKIAEFIVSGYWSQKAPIEAKYEGQINVLWDGKDTNYTKLPKLNNLSFSENAAYLHYVSNETVEGLEFSFVPGLDNVPLVCDMASDILSKPIDIDRYSLIYAHAQKNLGPAGVTLVIVKNHFLEKLSNKNLPTYFNYLTHINSNSIYNTPPVFAIYVMLLVTRWLINDIGGLKNMAKINEMKASLIYSTLDNNPDIYAPYVEDNSRSKMNVSFFLRNKNLQDNFLRLAKHEGFYGLEGHRSIGGLRASLYNAVNLDSTKLLSEFLENFAKKFS